MTYLKETVGVILCYIDTIELKLTEFAIISILIILFRLTVVDSLVYFVLLHAHV